MPKPIIFYDASFPGAIVFGEKDLEQLRAIGEVSDAEGVAALLREAEGGCFVSLHAPYFPIEIWEELLAFLKRGGGLISAGGSSVPGSGEKGGWRMVRRAGANGLSPATPHSRDVARSVPSRR